jgi:hypothetical protein
VRCIVYVRGDGTAAVVTPVPLDGEVEADTLARVAAQLGLGAWDAVRPEAVAALRRADQPAPGSLVPVGEFRERIVMVYVNLPSKPADVQAKWDRIIRDFLPRDRGPVNLLSPTTAALVAAAVADGLLTADEAAAVTAV